MKPHAFYEWASNLGRRQTRLVLAASAIHAALSSVQSWLSQHAALVDYSAITCGLQATLLILLLLGIGTPRTDPRHRIASIAARQFRNCWAFIVASWTAFYLILTVQKLSGASIPALRIAMNLTNNLSTLGFVVAFLVLSRLTVADDGTPSALPWIKGSGIVLLVLIAEVITMFLPDNPKLLSCFVWSSALAAGVGMALVFGRMESTLVGSPLPVMVSCYLYAVIQVGYASFSNPTIELIMTNAALVLKCILALYVGFLLQSGVLLFHLSHIRQTIKRGDVQQQHFIEQISKPRRIHVRKLSQGTPVDKPEAVAPTK